ncbi:hypothetical protein L208DRAFT_1499187, partial [Tricholoma matsutake]
ILEWQVPQSAKQVRQFLGLVRYISMFLLVLAEHTTALTPLTKKECNKNFPVWSKGLQCAFEAIKGLVLGVRKPPHYLINFHFYFIMSNYAT